MKILGLGDNVFDVYRNLNVSYPGGNAVNVAANAALLKHQSAYLGNFSDDKYGYYMKTILRDLDIDISECCTIEDSSTKKCVEDVIDGERQFLYVDLGKKWAGPYEIDNDNDIRYLNQFDAILTSCNAKMEDQIYKLKNIKGIISYDFGEKEKYRTKEYFDKICPYIDMAQFSMSNQSLEDIQSFIEKNSFRFPILITRGEDNPIFFDGQEYYEGNQNYVKPIDTMGAGDAYITAFVCTLLENGFCKRNFIEKSLIKYAMKKAAMYAAKVCLVNGGFGYPYQEKQLTAVIFDMDGVIVDSEEHWYHTFNGLLQKYQCQLNDSDRKELYGCSMQHEIKILSRYIHLPYNQLMKIKDEYSEKHPICYSDYIIDGVEDLLKYLKLMNIKVALASSSPMKAIYRMLDECNLKKYFDIVVSGEMFKESKPHPEIYQYTLKQLNVSRENVFVIEDSPYGVESAYRAKLDVLALKRDNNPFELEQAKLRFHSHRDILEYIKKGIKVEK